MSSKEFDLNDSIQISIVIPTYNEIKFINDLCISILGLDKVIKEIIFVDGGSSDGTFEFLSDLSKRNTSIKVIKNPDKYVSQGFNNAFNVSIGKYISLLGAHAIYPKEYFARCIEELEKGECNAAGGYLNQCGKTDSGKAIAFAMSSKFGVGNTEFRTIKKTMYVDSVAFAVYDRKVFEKVGLLDEELIRNQDDEFHYRLNQAGFRIKMIHDLEITYFVRESLKGLYKQYYQYGLYKPLVINKVSTSVRLRHLIPALFVIYLFILPLAFLLPIMLIPISLYFILIFLIFLKSSLALKSRMYLFLVFPVLHFSYGFGFLNGISFLWRQK